MLLSVEETAKRFSWKVSDLWMTRRKVNHKGKFKGNSSIHSIHSTWLIRSHEFCILILACGVRSTALCTLSLFFRFIKLHSCCIQLLCQLFQFLSVFYILVVGFGYSLISIQSTKPSSTYGCSRVAISSMQCTSKTKFFPTSFTSKKSIISNNNRVVSWRPSPPYKSLFAYINFTRIRNGFVEGISFFRSIFFWKDSFIFYFSCMNFPKLQILFPLIFKIF